MDSDPQQKFSFQDQIRHLGAMMQSGKLPTLQYALPLLLNLDNKPYVLEQHEPLEEAFRLNLPRCLTLMAGRQVGKSQCLGAKSVVLSATLDYFKTLFICPQYEQIRRLSANIVRPFIDTSPVKSMFTGKSKTHNVLQYTFKNQSLLQFSFALLNANRVRGIATHFLVIDEIQDMPAHNIPILRETITASPYALQQRSGTPKSLDNTMATSWSQSSQAEWFIPCDSCTTGGHRTMNIASGEHHLYKMIGPIRDDISEEYPGTICHKCRQPIRPRGGRWIHRYPERIQTHVGLHLPQLIFPLHFANKHKWTDIVNKQNGQGNTTPAIFANEVLGESCDIGSKLVTETDLRGAALLGRNTLGEAKSKCHSRDYKRRVLAVDWGGGGMDEISFTTIALLGYRYNGQIDVLYGIRLLNPHEHLEEAAHVLKLYRYFDCHLLAHDYTGAGGLRETFLIQAGLKEKQVMPCMLGGPAKGVPCKYHPPEPDHPRHYYMIDKSRTLLLTVAMIKLKQLRFFQYDKISEDQPGLLSDFLALFQEKMELIRAGEIYVVRRQFGYPDDFAQAVNLGCVACWHTERAWPNVAELAMRNMTPEQIAAMQPATSAQLKALGEDPVDPIDWTTTG